MDDVKVTSEQLKAAQGQSPTAIKVTVQGSIEVVVRRPTRAEWRIYRQMALSPQLDKQAGAGEMLFGSCCLVPAKADQAALLEAYPALPESLAGVLSRMAGFDAKADADF